MSEWVGRTDDSEEITVVERTYQIVVHQKQVYRCACGHLETALGPPRLVPGGRYAPEFAVAVATDKYRDAIPLTRQVDRMAESGLDVEVRSFEFATFFADIKKGSYQLATMQSGEIVEPDYYFMYFNSSRIPDASNPDGGNRWRYKNADVDRLTAAGRHELDRDQRKMIYREIQRLVGDPR